MSKNRVSVTVFVDSNGTHLHQLYSGLYFLNQRDGFNVRMISRSNLTKYRPNRQFLEAHFSFDASKRPIVAVYDLQDSPEIGLKDALLNCDVYFKRSYQPSTTRDLPECSAQKIQPYGFHYRVFDSDMSVTFWRLVLENLSRPVFPWVKKNQFHLSNVKDMLDKSFRNKKNNLVSSDFFSSIKQPFTEDGGVLFQCRLWDPDDVLPENRADTIAVNEMRISLVRALREEFGSGFVGGIQPTAYSKLHAPQLISELQTDRESYLKLISDSSIVICSKGLLESNGGKVAEAVALGRCIVAERIDTLLPVPFEEERNYLSFSTVSECISAVRKLRDDKCYAKKMADNNSSYYANSLHPLRLIELHIDALQEFSDSLSS